MKKLIFWHFFDVRAVFECILIKHGEIEDSNRFLIKHGEISCKYGEMSLTVSMVKF